MWFPREGVWDPDGDTPLVGPKDFCGVYVLLRERQVEPDRLWVKSLRSRLHEPDGVGAQMSHSAFGNYPPPDG